MKVIQILLFAAIYVLTNTSYKTEAAQNPTYFPQPMPSPESLLKAMATAGWAPTQLFCNCADGTRYSYGNNCKVATGLCDPNPCPPMPHGCDGH